MDAAGRLLEGVVRGDVVIISNIRAACGQGVEHAASPIVITIIETRDLRFRLARRYVKEMSAHLQAWPKADHGEGDNEPGHDAPECKAGEPHHSTDHSALRFRAHDLKRADPNRGGGC